MNDLLLLIPPSSGSVSGTGSATLPALTASATGAHGVSGDGQATLPELQASGTGYARVTGTGAVTMPAMQASGTGIGGEDIPRVYGGRRRGRVGDDLYEVVRKQWDIVEARKKRRQVETAPAPNVAPARTVEQTVPTPQIQATPAQPSVQLPLLPMPMPDGLSSRPPAKASNTSEVSKTGELIAADAGVSAGQAAETEVEQRRRRNRAALIAILAAAA